ARVSSQDKKQDLERQVERLREYAKIKGYEIVDVITDISSGLNTKRKGLQKLFEHVTSKEINTVLITNKDRLTRFGYEYLEYFLSKYNVKIEVTEGEEQKDLREELIEDLMSIITSFAGKLYGMRSKKKEKIIAEVKRVIEENERE
ncbi:MAG: IS607 family transposase, partial [Sulfolobus sp.]|nr:IS607 family transposase [Sulfolobus sp.]